MKNMLVWSLLGVGLFINPAFADDKPGGHHQVAMLVQQKCCVNCQSRTFHAVGTVIKIDHENGIVTIFHEPVSDLMWPSMTMPFSFEDKALFGRIKVGEKVKFEFVRETSNGVIVDIK